MKVVRDILRDTRSIARMFKHGDGPLDLLRTMTAYDGAQVMALTRLREAAVRHRVPLVATVLRRVQVGMFGIEIARDAQLGEGVLFLHTVGVVIGGDARIGDRVVFLGNITIGSNKHSAFPTIGDDVVIGAGARIVGEITIGDGAKIGANAVVLRDVPAGASASGVPAVVRSAKEARDDGDAVK